MKKILSLLFLVFISLGMVSCKDTETLTFEVPETMEYYIGDERPDYYDHVIAKTSIGTDLINVVEINDQYVNYSEIGTYTIFVTVTFQGEKYQKFIKVNVKEKSIEYVKITLMLEDVLIKTFEIQKNSLLSEPTHDEIKDKQFIGWSLDKEGKNLFDFSKIVLEDLTLYAQYVDIVYEYIKITFDALNDSDPYVVSVKKGEKVLEPEKPTFEGYTFVGWYIDSNLTHKFDFETQIYEDITLYAKYRLILNEQVELNFYYMNDMHGSLLNNPSELHIGLARIANVVLTEKENNPDQTIFITGGDMLQGDIISNYFWGANVIEMLNAMYLDAFVIGNHEFDWGIEKVLQYFNGTHEVQANYPILGANVYSKATNQMVEGFEPYTIIERNGIRIGIIGTMGYGLESSISFTRVNDYRFANPIEITESYAKHLRQYEDVDIVVAVNHQDDTSYNDKVAAFTGLSKVDIIFNGHTHNYYVRQKTRSNAAPIHIVQSASNSRYLGHVTLTYRSDSGVVSSQAENIGYYDNRVKYEHPVIQAMIESSINEISDLYEPILKSGEYVSKSDYAVYIAKLMTQYTNSDVGFHNNGGTRADIDNGEDLSYAKMFQISPFNNTVVSVMMSGRDLLNQLSRNSYYMRPGLTKNSINVNQMYKVVTNDYIFGNNNAFKNASAIEYYNVEVMELTYWALLYLKEQGYTTWRRDLEIDFSSIHQVSISHLSYHSFERIYA